MARVAAGPAPVPAAEALRRPVWCIFDNTALGPATADALSVFSRLAG